MAFRIQGTTVIDESGGNAVLQNVQSITYPDSTVQTTAAGGGAIGNLYTAGTLINTIVNPNAYSTSAGDYFGWEVDISGNYAIVGAPYESELAGASSGKAYIFNVTTGALLYSLNNPNQGFGTAATADFFGQSVGIDGKYAIVGAYWEDEAGEGSAGKAYIFDVTTGELLFTLTNPNAYSTRTSDYFGYSVAISGNYAIVGAYQDDDASGTESGKAFIFNVTTGALIHTLNNPNAYSTSTNDNFGWDVAISGNYAIVGAHQEADTSGTTSGKAYIFNVTTGALVQTLNNPNAYSTSADDQFGRSVDIDGNYAIVGARNEDDSGGAGSGKAYIFNATTGALVHTLNNPNAYSTTEFDGFGFLVSINGNYAAVSAISEDELNGTSSGKVYIFNVTTGALVLTLNNPNAYSTPFQDEFGRIVSLSGNYVMVGTFNEDDAGGLTSGAAYTFAITDIKQITDVQAINFTSGLTLSSKSKLFEISSQGELLHILDNPGAYSFSDSDLFGDSIATNGKYVLATAFQEDDAGGVQSGKAFVFDIASGKIIHTLNNPNAYSTSASDNFGRYCAMYGDYAAITSINEDDTGGTDSGKVYIFNVNTGSLIRVIDNPNAYSTSQGDNFGVSIALSADYVAVGAWQEDETSGASSGKVYVFDILTGSLLYTINNPNAYSTVTNDFFGVSVAFSGTYLIASTIDEDDINGTGSGKVYIFNASKGNLIRTIDNPNAYSTSASDFFGFALTAHGQYLAVSSDTEDDAGGLDSGKVYVFNIDTGALLYTINNPNAYSTSTADRFSFSLSAYGTSLVVGAYQEDDLSGTSSGKVYVFDIISGTLLYTINNPNPIGTSTNDRFGFGYPGIALYGNYLIVSASNEDESFDSQAGKVYIYNLFPTTYLDRLVQYVS